MVEGIQYGGGISSIRRRIFLQMCYTISMEEVHHQYSGGYAVSTRQIINQYRGECEHKTIKTARRVVGGYIYLGK